jgi:hypothetical protein
MVIHSQALLSLWQQVAAISHPDHPFLDKDYSPSTQMPAADYTAWVAERLASSDWESIQELLGYLNSQHIITAANETFNRFSLPSFLVVGRELDAEIRAIILLSLRIPWMGLESNRVHLMRELLTHSLAANSFHALPDDQAGNPETIYYHPKGIAALMASFPVTFRACVALSIERIYSDSEFFRADMAGHYSLRQYGLSVSDNEAMLDTCGVFSPASDLSEIAWRLRKNELATIATHCEIDFKKSETKEKMVGRLIEIEAAQSLIQSYAPAHLVQINPALVADFRLWREDLKLAAKIALRIIPQDDEFLRK